MQRTASPVGSRPDEPHNEEVKEPEISETPVEVSVTSPSAVPKSLSVRFSLPPAVATLPAADQSSDSDDEDIDDYFDSEIAKAEAELSKLEAVSESVPTEIVVRLAVLEHEHLAATVTEEGLKTLVGPLPEGVEFPRAKPVVQPPEEPSAEPAAEAKAPSPQPQTEAEPAQPVEAVVPLDSTTIQEPHVPAEPQPKVEEMDTDSAHIPIPTVEHPEPRGEEPAVVDVQMEDVGQDTDEAAKPETPQVNGHSNEGARHLLPAGFEMPPTGLSTPSQMEVEEAEEDDDETEIEEPDWATIETVRQYMKTPPLDELPDFSCRPWYKDRKFLKSFEPDPSVQAFVSSLIRDEAIVKYATQQEARHDYARQYEKYLRFTLSDDPAAVKSREFFSSIYPPSDAIVHPGPGHEPKPEGRRTGSRFATERDLERVLQASIQEEKERKERQERAEREKHRNPEKEADIPEMFWTPKEREVELFYDQSAFLPTEKLVAAWQVLPPVANFTEEEAELFEKAYLEFPKQWGKIAENIPTRDFHSCIQYYYIKKRELKLKEKLKKQPRRRKKRGKQRSSALVSELGNPDEVVEENHENGEHGERRRPRRAAAPTWNFEATPAADSDGAATPGRRGHGSKNDSGAEKPEKRSRRRGAHKEKEPKHAKQAQNLAPTPAATAKTNRSRSNSRAQGPEFLSPQTPADIASPATGMQPPLVPTQLPVSPDRGIPTTSSTMSEVMAPPSLRPDPPPPPPSTIAAFDLGQHSGSDRVRTPQQASSYWSVSETTDFPNLLASFGSDWNAIANHMQTKTHVMVKNYYVRQRDSGKQKDWELMVAEADAKRQRGDKLPTPPAVTAGPRTKRLDGPATSHRPLAAAGAPEEPHTAKETQVPLQPATAFGRFQVPVPIAQAPPAISASSSVSSGQSQQPLVPSQPQAAAVQQQAQPQPASQAAMSPTARPSRTPLVSGGYPEREPEPIASVPAQQPVRVPQKPGPPQVVFQQAGPASTPTDRDVWPSNYEPRLNLFNTSQQRRQPVELQPKEESRSMRLKQEPEAVLHYESSVPGQAHQPIARGGTARNEPVPIARQPEPPRSVAPAPQPYAAAQQPFKSILSEPVQGPSALSSAIERPMSAMQRPMSHSVPEPYSASTPQPPPQSLAPPPSRPPERKTSSLMALLNDDPPAAPPKRVSDMASTGLKPSSTPPPQSISRAPPPSAASQLRREGTPTYSPYSRNAPVQSAIPSLKPYAPTQTQSPQPQHLSAPRGSMMSPIEAGSVSDRDFYARHPYQPQVQQGASNSPQSHHYPPPQQSQLGYQSQPPPYGYGSPASQGHAPSPTPRYAAHPSVQARPDTGPPSRETAWPIPQSQQAPPSASQQPAWPQPKAAQPQPSAWGAQHGAPQKATPVTGSMPPQPSWSSAPPQHMSLRDVRDVRDDRSPVYAAMHDPRAAGGGDPRMMGHQHQSSLFGGRYPPTPTPRPEAAPPQQQVPPYPRYAGTPGPGQARDPGPGRSYTPVSAYDNRPPGPPQGPYVQEVQMRQDAQMRQEVQMRDLRGELRGDPRDLRGDLRDPRDPVSQLQRGLRPHEDYRQQERRY
ncbi:Myb-like DNA-binding protein [Pleurostoma richardsiae]|uniref:Myb-like DNA-binding protein n=1 Tax=Pleurostoma richardsiae TaxID=41990 RepID=A0AA38VE21_9PEZI|nr:Myb-like DNA-binding protein [Pleurostoma richardsiae]